MDWAKNPGASLPNQRGPAQGGGQHSSNWSYVT